jgi:catechol 2,3-dioxygenase-like lactoylglutathione lyase family enzyme
MGHVHLNVRDIEASKKFYLGLGGTAAKLGSMEVIKFPGVLFILRKADPTNGMEGSSVNHIGFVVKDGEGLMARMKEQGVKIASNGMDWRGGYVYSPEGVKIELIPRPTLAVRSSSIRFTSSSQTRFPAAAARGHNCRPGIRRYSAPRLEPRSSVHRRRAISRLPRCQRACSPG